jgi:hypothetical protein
MGDDEQGNDRRLQAPDPPSVKAGETERTVIQRLEDDRGGQVSGDDEKDVDPDEAGREQRQSAVKNQHQQHRDGTKAVDIGAVFK